MLNSYGADCYSCIDTSERRNVRTWRKQFMMLLGTVFVLGCDFVPRSLAQTAFGELEARFAPVIRRQCVAGSNIGQLCKQDSDCSGSVCQTSNIFDISVNIFDTTVQQAKIENAFTKASKLLFQVTGGQAQFGKVTAFTNATGKRGLFWITNVGGCWAHPGSWGLQSGGNIIMESSFLTLPQSCLTHEFVHTVFDGLDEYIKRDPNCGAPHAEGVSCPNSGVGGFCLMSSATSGTQLCWGHAVGSDFSAGNHDAGNFTAQSSCRDKRSCWDQIPRTCPSTGREVDVRCAEDPVGPEGLILERVTGGRPSWLRRARRAAQGACVTVPYAPRPEGHESRRFDWGHCPRMGSVVEVRDCCGASLSVSTANRWKSAVCRVSR